MHRTTKHEDDMQNPDREVSPLTSQESKDTQYPSSEAIKTQLERLSGKENLQIVRTLEDEKGIYLHEVISVDKEGDTELYSYRRSGIYKATQALTTSIDVEYFEGGLEDGMPIGGKTLSEYDKDLGKWRDTK